MSISSSDLSASQYGYDFVVGMTQGSINSAMTTFLTNLSEPEVKIVYIADASGNPTQIDFQTLLTNANGSDPFSVPADADPTTNPDLANLLAARFMAGFKARIGIPAGGSATVRDIVTLGSDTSSVTFNLMCSEFQIVNLQPSGGYNPASWTNISQDPADPWVFTSKVDLRMFATDQSAYNQLPPAVQKRIQDLSGQAFSVQQLLFDLDNAALQTVPQLGPSVPPGSTQYMLLQKYFLGAYFTQMQTQGAPLLGATIALANAPDQSTLTLTNVNMEVSAFVGSDGQPLPNPTTAQQDLSTLNYLCAANNHTPRAPVAFTWNWIDAATDGGGVVSINRNTFAQWFQTQLTPYVMFNCFTPAVRVWLTDAGTTVNYQWSMHRNASPTVTIPPAGQTVLSYTYSGYAEDDAGLGGDMGHMTLTPSMNVTVDFVGSTIVVTQHLVVGLYIKYLATPASANVVDLLNVDTYTLSVDPSGALHAVRSTPPVTDHSELPSANGFLNFFADVDSLASDVTTWMQAFTKTAFESELPLSAAQKFVFPGGNTFTFADVAFSANQDLASHVSYDLSSLRTAAPLTAAHPPTRMPVPKQAGPGLTIAPVAVGRHHGRRHHHARR